MHFFSIKIKRLHFRFHGALLTGQSGIFPKDFIAQLDLPQVEPGQRLFAAVDSFRAEQYNDLGFNKGDFIIGTKQIDANWWEGMCKGRRGIFPSTLVVDLSSGGQTNNKISAKVVADLKAQLPDEIDLHKGEIVYITQYIDKYFCRGTTADGTRTGSFPKNFVEILDDNSQAQSVISEKPSSQPKQRQLAPAAITQYQNLAEQSDEVQPYGRAKYSFKAEFSGELSFHQGDVVQLIHHVDDEWTEGLVDGKIGIFPTSYVDIIVDCPSVEEVPLQRSDSGYTSAMEPLAMTRFVI